MERKKLIERYIEFFKEKEHNEAPNVSLIPQNDPTALFITAGMHPLVPYLLGQPHPQGKRLVNVQKCLRTTDIEEIGDATHHTFFEMLGNWSLGDYFKKETIKWSFEFLTEILRIPQERIAVTVFEGDKDAPKDEESAEIWKSIGIPKERIAFLNKDENWWGPAGQTGPCGPDTEVFYWKPKNIPPPKEFNPEDENWVEIWNNVLMEYIKDDKGNYIEAKQKNVDTGMGVERTITILNNLEDNYLTKIWQPIIKKIEEITSKNYQENKKEIRIIADHLRSSVFMIADGVEPTNTDQGYILRRLIRRAIRSLYKLNIKENFNLSLIAEEIIKNYKDYEHLEKNKKRILKLLKFEEEKFGKTLEKGLNKLERIIRYEKEINCRDAFLLFQSFGFPIEMTIEIAKEKGIKVDEKGFYKECQTHQEKSRTAAAGKFKSGLADQTKLTTRLHTAAHLLLQSLKIILDDKNIIQKGSNINPERLRLDFSFPRKITPEEIKKVEDLVNLQIENSCEIIKEEMSLEDAKKSGAEGTFEEKYGNRVSVYTIKNKEGIFNKEICTGPHVKNTKELGKFRIKKEESVGAGIRRIKAILEE